MGVAALRGKRVDSRTSPEPSYTPMNHNMFEHISPKSSKDKVRGVEEGEEEEVVDNAEVVC